MIERFFHVIQTQQFDRKLLDDLFQLTEIIRKTAKTQEGLLFLHGLLSHKRMMLYFTQPSTRTFLSFNSACQILGIQTSEIRDASISSEMKGESFLDAIRTFSSYVDAIVMRTDQAGQALEVVEFFSKVGVNVPIINAGSGPDQHPTQSLLDVYTIQKSFENQDGLDRKTIGLMGDLKRGRTARSLCYLMKNFQDVKLIFIAPPEFQMKEDILNFLKQKKISFSLSSNLEEVLPSLDVLYVTRLQDEYDQNIASKKIDMSSFKLKLKHLPQLKSSAIIMHPFPRRDEIDVEIDNDPRAVYWKQEENGMWVRTALLVSIFGQEQKLLERG